MKKLVSLFAGSLFLMGCIETNVVVDEKLLSRPILVCTVDYTNTGMHSDEVIQSNKEKNFLNISRFYHENDKELVLRAAISGNWKLSGNKLIYAVNFLQGDELENIQYASNKNPKISKFIETIYSNYSPNGISFEKDVIIERTITKFEQDRFEFTQKVANGAQGKGICFISKELDLEKTN